MTVVRHIEAFMDDADAPKPNAIHSTAGAREYGYSGALIGGVTAYGWCVGAIVEALGERWLDCGWATLAFKRPMYPGDRLVVTIAADGALRVSRGDAMCFEGAVGLGIAAWLDELAIPSDRVARDASAQLPVLTLANAPVGRDLLPMAAQLDAKEAAEFARTRERETLGCFYGDTPRIHPAWIAEQPIRLLHHSFDYGPSIHAHSRIQHLAPVRGNAELVVAGRCTSAYERNGHDYIENDCSVIADGVTVARLRHTSVFRIAKRDASHREEKST
jgi:hypothetical protein